MAATTPNTYTRSSIRPPTSPSLSAASYDLVSSPSRSTSFASQPQRLNPDDSDDEIVWSASGGSSSFNTSESDGDGVASDDDYVLLSRPHSRTQRMTESSTPVKAEEQSGAHTPVTTTGSLEAQMNVLSLETEEARKAARKAKKAARRAKKAARALKRKAESPEEKADRLAAKAAKKAKKAAKKALHMQINGITPEVIAAQKAAKNAEKKAKKALQMETGISPEVKAAQRAAKKAERKAKKALQLQMNGINSEVQTAQKAAKKAEKKALRMAKKANLVSNPLTNLSITATEQDSASEALHPADQVEDTSVLRYTGLGARPIVDDFSDRQSIISCDRDSVASPTLYEEASVYISSFLSNPHAKDDSVCRLTLLQSLIIELGLATPSLPDSLSAAKTFLKSRAFLNIREYIAVREDGPEAVQRAMFPSRSALIKDIRKKRKYASLKWVKQHGLQVLLVGVL